MKKISLITLLLLVCIIGRPQSFKGGLLAGLITSQVDGDTYSGYNRAGINAGGYVRLNLSKNFDWQMEMKFAQKGSHKKANFDIGDYTDYRLRLNYLEIPLIIKYKYKPKINFDAGLGVGYLASSKWKDDYGVLDGGAPFNKYEFSYHIGGNYQVLPRIAFNIRYSYSLFPIRTGIEGQRYIMLQWGQFNNVLSFSFYYQFNKPDE